MSVPNNLILIDAGPSERGWHRLEAALRCPQLYAWGYGQNGGSGDSRHRGRFPPAEPLVRGAIGHVGLAHLYKRLQCVQQEKNYSGYYSPAQAMALMANKFGDLGESCLPPASRAVRAYSQHYGIEPFEVVEVEKQLGTEFHGYRYTARVDLVIRDHTEKVWFYDHKFIGRIEGKVYRRYLLSGQFLGLQWLGARNFGDRFAGVRLNLVGWRDLSLDRATLEPAPWMLERFPEVVRGAEERISEIEKLVELGKIVPASPSEHTCWGSYGECPAFEMCRWGGRSGK